MGPPRSNAFFSTPLTTRAPPTTARPDVRPDIWLNAWPNVSRLKRKPEKSAEKYLEQTLNSNADQELFGRVGGQCGLGTGNNNNGSDDDKNYE